MPRIKSAKKRVEVSERNRLRNTAYKSALRTAIKKALTAAEEGSDQPFQDKNLQEAYSLIDRAVLKGILHKNAGARYKARIAKAFTRKSA